MPTVSELVTPIALFAKAYAAAVAVDDNQRRVLATSTAAKSLALAIDAFPLVIIPKLRHGPQILNAIEHLRFLSKESIERSLRIPGGGFREMGQEICRLANELETCALAESEIPPRAVRISDGAEKERGPKAVNDELRSAAGDSDWEGHHWGHLCDDVQRLNLTAPLADALASVHRAARRAAWLRSFVMDEQFKDAWIEAFSRSTAKPLSTDANLMCDILNKLFTDLPVARQTFGIVEAELISACADPPRYGRAKRACAHRAALQFAEDVMVAACRKSNEPAFDGASFLPAVRRRMQHLPPFPVLKTLDRGMREAITASAKRTATPIAPPPAIGVPIPRNHRRPKPKPKRERTADTALMPAHSDDFTSVNWFGTNYEFDIGNQAKAIALLWTEYEKGGLGLHEKTIGEKIGSSSNRFRLCHVFRDVPAWGKMIQSVEGKRGQFKLAPPPGITK